MLFLWTDFISLHPRMLSVKFAWNWLSGSEEDFKVSSICQLFCYYHPLGKSLTLHLNRFEPKNASYKVWSKLPSGSGEKDVNLTSLQTDRWTDKTMDNSLLELSAQVSWKGFSDKQLSSRIWIELGHMLVGCMVVSSFFLQNLTSIL